ncbi:MAG: maleate cis-trans isomerase [Chloroflexi bacterium]|nr:maleate cis-trans isomerase [Chloroflexota bacterium]
MLPQGVGVLITTLMVESRDDAEIEREGQRRLPAAQMLAASGAQFLIAGGGPMMVAGGYGTDARIIAALAEATGLRATTNLTAGVEALRALGARRIALATPFRAVENERYDRFLTASGFEVTAIRGPQCNSNREIGLLDGDAAYRAAREAVAAGGAVEAVYIPCGRWPAVEVVGALETDLGIPVVASNQAVVWAALKGLGVSDRVPGRGRLLASG